MSELVGPGPAALTTDRAAYRPGDQGTMTLRNRGSEELRFDLCPRQLERLCGGRWIVTERLPYPGEGFATELCRLAPGATADASFRLARGLACGTYRWRFFGVGDRVGAPAPDGGRLTNRFQVEA